MRIKLIGICLALLMMTAFAACSNQVSITDDMTPTQTAQAFLDSFKAQDWDTIDQIYAGKGSDFAAAYGTSEDSDAATDALQDVYLSKLYDFDYEVTGETIAEDEKTATVDVTVTTYNMVEVFNNFYQEYMDQALEKYSGNSAEMKEEDLEEMAVSILEEQMENAEKDYVSNTTMSMTKTDGKWIIDESMKDDEAFLNAVSGGMMDVAGDIANAKKGEDTEKDDK